MLLRILMLRLFRDLPKLRDTYKLFKGLLKELQRTYIRILNQP